MSLRHLLDAIGNIKNIRPGVGVHVGIATVGVIFVVGGIGLPSQMPSANKQQPAKREPENNRFKPEQTGNPHPGEQDDPVIKTQQAPRRLVRDQRVNDGHQNRVKNDKTKQPGVGSPHRSPDREAQPNQRQQEN